MDRPVRRSRCLASKCGFGFTGFDKISARMSFVFVLRSFKVRSAIQERNMARRADWNRDARDTRSMSTPDVTAEASIYRTVGLVRTIPSSLYMIWKAMIDLPAHVAMMSSDPALLSARRRGDRHSTENAPDPGKNRANPP